MCVNSDLSPKALQHPSQTLQCSKHPSSAINLTLDGLICFNWAIKGAIRPESLHGGSIAREVTVTAFVKGASNRYPNTH
jgi:hypothetical protein